MASTFAEAEEIEAIQSDKNDVGWPVAGLFPPYEPDWFLKASAELCYNQHGGSGLNFTLSDVKDMYIDEIEFYLEWLDERRSEEAKAIQRANKK